MANETSLPRQNSQVLEGVSLTPTWYNFVRRLADRLSAVENAPVLELPPPYLEGGCCDEITVQDATTARTLTADDDKVNVEFTNASAITVTVNADVMPGNSITYLTQGNTGQVTVVAGAGVTIDYSDSLKTRTQESMIGLKQIQVNKFELFGDAEPVAPARSALIRSANSVGAPAFVAPTADGQVLKRSSGTLIFDELTAAETTFTPYGTLAATNVQDAIEELLDEGTALDLTDVTTDVKLTTVGTGLYLSEGTNATMGVATLVAGSKVVSTTKVTANSRIFVSIQSLGTVTVPKGIGVTARTSGTSFTLTSADATDTSVIAWHIIEPIISTIVTWNPADKSSDITLSGSDLIATMTGTNVHRLVRATHGRSTGKYYFEILSGSGVDSSGGVADSGASLSAYCGSNATSYGYAKVNGNKYNNSTGSSYGASYTSGDVVGIAVDLDAGKIWFAKNNTWQASGDPAAGTNAAYTGLSGTKYPALSVYNNAATATGRFKSADFSYSPPSGFSAWE
jgi:hypothetical protein